MVCRGLPSAFALLLIPACTRDNPGFAGTDSDGGASGMVSADGGASTSTGSGGDASGSQSGSGGSDGKTTDSGSASGDASGTDATGAASDSSGPSTTGHATDGTTAGESGGTTTAGESGTDATGVATSEGTQGTSGAESSIGEGEGGATGTTSGADAGTSGGDSTSGDTGDPNLCDPDIDPPNWIKITDVEDVPILPECPEQTLVVHGLVTYDNGVWLIPNCGDCLGCDDIDATEVTFGIANNNGFGPLQPPEGTCVRIEVEYLADPGLGSPSCGSLSGITVQRFEPDTLLFVASSKVTHAPAGVQDILDATRELNTPCDCAEATECCAETPGDYDLVFSGSYPTTAGVNEFTLATGENRELDLGEPVYQVHDFASYVASTCGAAPRVEWAMRLVP